MQNNRTSRAFFLAALSLGVLNLSPALAQSPDKWGAHLDLEGKLGTERNLGEGGLFLPLYQTPDTLVFGDLRMRFDDNESHEANVGAGVRRMLGSGWNIGGYGYFDRRESPYDNYFNQITVGAEALGRDVDLRLNSYWAIGDRSRAVDSLGEASISGSSITMRGGEERSMSGFDAEVGWRVPLFDAEADKQLRFYVGGYRFTADDVESIQGPRARVDFTMNELPFLWEGSRLSLGAEWQHDDPRGSQAFAGLRLRIPLQHEASAPRLTAQAQRMTDTVIRDIDVVTRAGAFGPVETASRTASGQAITVLTSAANDGAALQTGLDTAGTNSTVVLSGTFTTTSTTTLQSGQTVTSGTGLQVISPSGRVATMRAGNATINGSPGAATATIAMANNSTLSGMTINDTENNATVNAIGITASGVSGAHIIGNTVVSTNNGVGGTAHGIMVVSGSSNVLVSGNSVTVANNSGSTAIGVQVNTSSATVTGNSLSAIRSSTGGGTFGHTHLQDATILTGSTGNSVVAGPCSTSGTNSGSVSYTNAANCGP